MDFITLSVLLASISIVDELVNGKWKISARLLQWIEDIWLNSNEYNPDSE